MNLLIAGSRSFNDYDTLEKVIGNVLKEWGIAVDDIECVVSGRAAGADQLGEHWARRNNIPIDKHPANWQKYGKKAGYIRNKKMGKVCDAAIIFWDGESRGARMMVDIIIDLGKPIYVWVKQFHDDIRRSFKKSY